MSDRLGNSHMSKRLEKTKRIAECALVPKEKVAVFKG